MKMIYIYGAGGHGLVVADIAKACGYQHIQFVDDHLPYYPSLNDIVADRPITIGVGDNTIRAKIFDKLQHRGFEMVSLIHPTATIADTVSIGVATVIMPHVVVNAKSTIGKGSILNTASVIEHENMIGSFVHISPNVSLGGAVTVGDFTHVGIGSIVIQGIQIGNASTIGAGSVLVKHIPQNCLAYGNPCRVVKNHHE